MLIPVVIRWLQSDSVFTDVPPQPEQSVFRFKGFERPLCSNLPRNLWFPHADHELFQQLRTPSVPRKIHLAGDSECAGLQAVARVWNWL